MAISDPRLPDNPIVHINDAFEQLTGYRRDEVVGRNCRFLQGPLTAAADVDRLRTAIARRERIVIDLLNHRKDGTPFWNRLHIAPVFDADGELCYFVASQHDVTLERRQQVDLADSASRLEFALKAGRLGAWTLDPATGRLDASTGCKAVFGRAAHEPFDYDDLRAAIHPEDRDRVLAAIDRTIATGADYDIEYRLVTPAGEVRWAAIRGELLTRRDGSPLSMSGFSTDITERRRMEEHRELLAGELTHRVKNTLATVGAIVNQTLRDAGSMEAARDTIAGRIASLAVAHDLLLREEVEGAAIGDIVAGVMAPFDDTKGRRLTMDGPDVKLEPRVALAFSMALHELATNASKYGALSVADGHVTIAWHIDAGVTGRRLAFRWQESGGPPVVTPTRTGFGSRMIERVLAQHIRGKARVDYRPDGVVFDIDAPL
ncbi:PAS domain-containing protein [Sphingomonas sp. BT553]|uniref:histidine kinase n=2 Tax=Sphingomonas mollis TaxID=2795726 RepID=A0ABS0XM33_9SPHN|nr:PAS domain-containing protein [Sphingomonas sp. BT553]MBJ6121104.1 PAS domain-containing protein [Sphingomonas sp. BT553]